MNFKVCKGCWEIFADFKGVDYCAACKLEISFNEKGGWLEISEKEVEKK